jgi:PAS domain S-box-containing protein
MKLTIILFDRNNTYSIFSKIEAAVSDIVVIQKFSSIPQCRDFLAQHTVHLLCIAPEETQPEDLELLKSVKQFFNSLAIIALRNEANEEFNNRLIEAGVDDILSPNEPERFLLKLKILSRNIPKETLPIAPFDLNMQSGFQSFIFLDKDFKVKGFNEEAKSYAKRIMNLDLIMGLDGLYLSEGHQKIKTYLVSALTGKPSLLETSIITADKTKLWFAINFMPIHDKQGNVEWICINAIDITQQKLAEYAIRKAEQTNQMFYENELVGLYQTSIKGELLNANTKLAQMLGFSSSKSLFNSHRQYPKDFYQSPERWKQLLQSLKNKGSLSEFVSAVQDNKNHKLWFSEFIRGLYDRNGELVGLEGTVVNITEYKRTQQKLRETKDLVYQIYDHVSFGICLVNDAEIIQETNPAIRKLSGFKAGDLHGKPLSFLFKNTTQDGSMVYDREKKRHRNYEQKLLHHEGYELDVLISESLIEVQNGQKQKIISVSNITEQKRIQEELYRSKERFKSIISNLPIIIITTDQDGVYTFVDGRGLNDAGIDPNSLLGKSAFEIFKHHKSFIRTINRVLSGETVHGSFTIYGRHFESTALPVYDSDGKITGSMSVSFDITNRVKAEEEKEKLHSQLLQSQKLEAIGTLTGGIAHEFNNLLAIILGNANLLNATLNNNNLHYKHLDRVIAASNRASQLTKKLLAFSRQAESEFIPLDINECIESVVELLEHTVDKRIKLSCCLSDNLPKIYGDLHQLEQVFLNLAVNACDAINTKLDRLDYGECQFKTRLIEPDDSLKNIYQITTDSPMILLEIADNGIGIKEELQEKVFEPFFTTKSLGKGTGLGLSIVYGIITTHNGIIDINSVPGEGTVFSIYLPTIAENVAAE